MRYLFVLMLLAGCATQEQRAEEQRARAAQHRVAVEDQCFRYGFKPNTKEWPNCLMQVDMAFRQQDANQRQMLLQQYMQQQGIFRR